ncbi:MAG: hypothetical protein NUV82_01415 [Candidatus Komeilibacteria bacterium]|nr:hypothetical protein [Candidatus Komeilibacteria bacterium]
MLNKFSNWLQRSHVKEQRRDYLIIMAIAVVLIGIIIYSYSVSFADDDGADYGLSFSSKYAEQLGLDWQETYIYILENMPAKYLRLMTYWDEIEVADDEYDYSRIKWQLEKAAEYDKEVLLIVGRRQPRWPECHIPSWVYNLNDSERLAAEYEMIARTISELKDYSVIFAWQIDNEPFLSVFGECPEEKLADYREKLTFAADLDSRPLVVTDSGEFSLWLKAARLNPIVGVSLYRTTWNKWYGKFFYPLAPSFYQYKARLISFFAKAEQVFISELQLEPWADQSLAEMPLPEQYVRFPVEQVEENIHFARRTGLEPRYGGGAEWWYWLKTEKNNSADWDAVVRAIEDNQ